MGLTPYVHLDTDLGAAAEGDRVTLSSDDLHHLRRVLRLPAGADVEVADGRGWTSTAALTHDGVRLLAGPVHVPAPAVRLTVAQALAKGRKFDDVVRQVTELGVDAVVPVAASRSVVRLDDDRAARAVERWAAVARAASEQARRPHRPVVEAVAPVPALAALAGSAAEVLVAHPGAPALPDVLDEVAPGAGDHLVIAVGPEGGWTDDEVAVLVAGGAHRVGLGPAVLRTEHAAAAAAAVVAAGTGRWR